MLKLVSEVNIETIGVHVNTDGSIEVLTPIILFVFLDICLIRKPLIHDPGSSQTQINCLVHTLVLNLPQLDRAITEQSEKRLKLGRIWLKHLRLKVEGQLSTQSHVQLLLYFFFFSNIWK